MQIWIEVLFSYDDSHASEATLKNIGWQTERWKNNDVDVEYFSEHCVYKFRSPFNSLVQNQIW